MKKKLGPKTFLFPMPALLVGTYNDDGTANAMTAAWTGICCFEPPCAGVAVRKPRLTYANIEKRKAFTLNVPSTSQASAVDYVGMVSGKTEPKKLDIAKLKVEKASKIDAPLIVSCPLNLECRLVSTTVLGSHAWFAGEILEVHVDEHCLKGNDIDIFKLDPLIYITSVSKYHAIGKEVAQAYKIGNRIRKG